MALTDHILNQQEIDALMKEYSDTNSVRPSGRKGNVLAYDFRHPLLVSKDQLRALRFLHESFAWNLSVELTGQLRKDINIRIIDIDQVVFSEFTQSVGKPSALCLFTINELGGQALFEMDPQFALLAIERLIGGDAQYLVERRKLTTIELNVFRKVLATIYKELEAAWEPYLSISIDHHSIENGPENIQVISPVESTIVVYQQIKVHDWKFNFNVTYPYDLLEKHLSQNLFRSGSRRSDPVSEEERSGYLNRIKELRSTLNIELGNAAISVNELLRLSVGDAIVLEQKTCDPLKVYLKNELLCRAYPGRLGNKRAIRVLDFIENEQIEVKK
ncbi:MAG TPA: flagellar motor switch protein FliM [Balneolales bacterium]|nr:flagellar motor switch protein FliM [Balneolales bacterium]